jgi:hypothetical protein
MVPFDSAPYSQTMVFPLERTDGLELITVQFCKQPVQS